MMAAFSIIGMAVVGTIVAGGLVLEVLLVRAAWNEARK